MSSSQRRGLSCVCGCGLVWGDVCACVCGWEGKALGAKGSRTNRQTTDRPTDAWVGGCKDRLTDSQTDFMFLLSDLK